MKKTRKKGKHWILVSMGAVVFPSIITVAASAYQCGDVNCDYAVNLKDVTVIRRLLADSDAELSEKAETCDVNKDGMVDENDRIYLQRYLAGGWSLALPEIGGDDGEGLAEDLSSYEIFSTEKTENDVICTAFRYGTSVQQRDLVCYSIQQENFSRTILLNLGIHGWEDSYAADGQLLVNLGNELVENYASSEDLNDCRLLIIPSANPDGVQNGITNNGFGRCNAEGIDLNRDFDANHVVNTSDRYYTPYPFSAQESRALRDLVLVSQPEIVLDFHGWLNYTIGSSELAEVFSMEVGLSHKNELTSNASGYFTYWAQLQGAEALLVEFKDTDSIVTGDVIQAIDRLIENNYGSKQSDYELDPDFIQYDSIVSYALNSDRIYTQKYVGDTGTSYGYIDGGTDQCTILQIYENGWCKVSYPVGSAGYTKTGYCEISNFIDPSTLVIPYSGQVYSNTKVYTTPQAVVQLGSVWTTDTFTVVAENGEMLQIIYPVDSGGYKMGWIYKSSI